MKLALRVEMANLMPFLPHLEQAYRDGLLNFEEACELGAELAEYRIVELPDDDR